MSSLMMDPFLQSYLYYILKILTYHIKYTVPLSSLRSAKFIRLIVLKFN